MQIDALEKMLEAGQDSAMLRYGLANAYWQQGDMEQTIIHASQAVKHQPDYSAAWQIYAKALERAGYEQKALEAYEQGLETARKQGDKQVENVLSVRHKKLAKRLQ